jgi:hypothetical protein
MRPFILFVMVAALMRTAGAQIGSRCPLIIIDGVVQAPAAGPGQAFGVTAYQCTSCSHKKEGDARAEYSFNAEPVVLETATWSPLKAGDVIEAVNGHPITTRAGADQFTYPPAGEALVMVRRGGARVELRMAPHQGCADRWLPNANRIERVAVIRGETAVLRYGLDALQGAIVITTKKDSTPPSPLQPNYRTIRPESTTAMASPGHGRFGFALSCVPSCTRVRASGGTDYWRFDGHPPIAGIMPGGPAAMAGLRVGDVVTEIDGISILSEDGALRFQRSERKESIRVTVLRDGKRVEYSLQPR